MGKSWLRKLITLFAEKQKDLGTSICDRFKNTKKMAWFGLSGLI